MTDASQTNQTKETNQTNETNMSCVSLTTFDGETLEAVASEWGPACRCGVVLAHPNPARGGTFDSPVIVALQHALAAANIASIRFNFRGTGTSTGRHDNGVAERNDVVAALAWAHQQRPDIAIHLVGYSFGARVALSVSDPTVASWVAIAPPLLHDPCQGERALTASDLREKLLLIPENDQFCMPHDAAAVVASWNATTIETINGADHFLGSHLPGVVNLIVGHITNNSDK
jgi:uncharacterized protein